MENSFVSGNSEINPVSEDVSRIGAWASVEIKKIDESARTSKKEIIQEAARRLEGKIPIDKIAMELVKQLCDVVNGHYVRECLDDKYKQQYRRENAEKQRRKLAKHTPLNPQSVQLIEQPNGTVLVQKSHDGPLGDSKVFENSTYGSSNTKKVNQIDVGTFVTLHSARQDNTQNAEVHSFSIPWEAIHAHMQSIFAECGRNAKVSFYVVIDKQNRQLVTAGLGTPSEYPGDISE